MEWMIGIVGAISTAVVGRAFVTGMVVPEGFVGLLYRHGRFVRSMLPGKHRLFGFGYAVTNVDVRKAQVTVPGQEVLTADNVGIKVSALLSYRVVDAARVTHEVQNYWEAIYGAAQIALREAIGSVNAEALLENRVNVGGRLRERVASELNAIGIETLSVEIKDVMLPGELRKAFAEAIKARKEGAAALERARAESAALRNLANAAKVLENNPGLMNLRVLQTVADAKDGQSFVFGTGVGLMPVAKTGGES